MPYYKLLYIFTYPCGYHSNNILLIFSILFTAIGAYFVRLFGFECIVRFALDLLLSGFQVLVSSFFFPYLWDATAIQGVE
jgi:hypothetical protein